METGSLALASHRLQPRLPRASQQQRRRALLQLHRPRHMWTVHNHLEQVAVSNLNVALGRTAMRQKQSARKVLHTQIGTMWIRIKSATSTTGITAR